MMVCCEKSDIYTKLETQQNITHILSRNRTYASATPKQCPAALNNIFIDLFMYFQKTADPGETSPKPQTTQSQISGRPTSTDANV